MNRTSCKNNEEIETQNFVADFYEERRYKNIYSRKWHDWHIKMMLGLADKEKLEKGKILDNGCGNGILAEYIAGDDLYGIDISPKMADLAKKRMKNVTIGDSENLPFGAEVFDVVFSRSLLHHLIEPQNAVKEAYRVLKFDGQAIFDDTLRSFLNVLPRKIANRGKHFSSSHKNFKESELINLIRPLFKIEKIVYSGFVAYPVFAMPDLINFSKFIPFKNIIFKILMAIDNIFMKLPLIKKQAWGITILARKI